MKKIIFLAFAIIVGMQFVNAEEVLGTYEKFTCGGIEFPMLFAEITTIIINIIQILVPIVIIIMGSIDLVKAVVAQKDDEITKGFKVFLRRLIIGCVVFFVVAIVKLAVGLLGNSSNDSLKCIVCFTNSGDCNPVVVTPDTDTDEEDTTSDETTDDEQEDGTNAEVTDEN